MLLQLEHSSSCIPLKTKNMWVTIEEAMDNKDLILNATSENNEIKVGIRIFVKNICESLSLETKEFCPCYAPSLHLSPLYCTCHYCNLPNPNIQN
jgi:hypothetical protein